MRVRARARKTAEEGGADSLRGSSVKIGEMLRIIAWPLHKHGDVSSRVQAGDVISSVDSPAAKGNPKKENEEIEVGTGNGPQQ